MMEKPEDVVSDDETSIESDEETVDSTDSEEEESEEELEDIPGIAPPIQEEEEEEEDDEEFPMQKLENYLIGTDLEQLHPEIRSVNFEEVEAFAKVTRDKNGKIIDPLHTTIPFLTKYEKARIIGARAQQIDRGATPFVQVSSQIIQGRTIALLEFQEKKIPFIIARPLPNQAVEYWRIEDLEVL